mmetsp:Transcript_38911/g.93184  ORF Transcript_38911/g.93184 Transcript_38911/m.93184 type:complete len:261 (+) Transcript_38911:3-785(+)
MAAAAAAADTSAGKAAAAAADASAGIAAAAAISAAAAARKPAARSFIESMSLTPGVNSPQDIPGDGSPLGILIESGERAAPSTSTVSAVMPRAPLRAAAAAPCILAALLTGYLASAAVLSSTSQLRRCLMSSALRLEKPMVASTAAWIICLSDSRHASARCTSTLLSAEMIESKLPLSAFLKVCDSEGGSSTMSLPPVCTAQSSSQRHHARVSGRGSRHGERMRHVAPMRSMACWKVVFHQSCGSAGELCWSLVKRSNQK